MRDKKLEAEVRELTQIVKELGVATQRINEMNIEFRIEFLKWIESEDKKIHCESNNNTDQG